LLFLPFENGKKEIEIATSRNQANSTVDSSHCTSKSNAKSHYLFAEETAAKAITETKASCER
jgi:hypothetical protein